MKVYNATNSSLDLPYGMHRLKIDPNSFSQDFMGTIDFVKTLVSSYTTNEVAILVGGPYELSMCAGVPVAVNYVAQTTDEIVRRFGLEKKEGVKPAIPEPKPEPEPEIPVVEGENEVSVGEESEPAPAPKKKKTTRKKKVDE